MTVLVTGGAGYIGSHMVWKLLDEGEDVIVIDRLSTGFAWAVPGTAKLIVGDLGDEALVRGVLADNDIEAIIHFAGSTIVPESVADPLSYYLNNTVNSRALIASAVAHKVPHFIFSSTAAVYGNPKQSQVGEDEPTYPESAYGHSKLMTEIMLKDTARAHPITYTALRYFNVSGADPAMRTGQSTAGATHLIKVACEAALGKRTHLDIYGTDWPTPDGTCIRDFIHVSDLVEAHYLALTRLRNGGSSLVANCGYGKGYSVRDVISAVTKATGRDFDVRETDRRPGDLMAVTAKNDIALREFSWVPKYDDLNLIVANALDWEDRLMKRNDTV